MLRGKELDQAIENELQLMLLEGYDKSWTAPSVLDTKQLHFEAASNVYGSEIVYFTDANTQGPSCDSLNRFILKSKYIVSHS
ncbi:hypothetical protein [Acinetobacter pseudolwoffii]|uniref:hypothetical protein n=1 Tax=Acinetobacter pseudolwoffii TaxID=2053287 RepID=UPI000C2420C5|nr:hypothetical protein [Acinetobacter pseudolwoffii]PJI28540.1 hypothetical protein CU478_13835 [Acinetobacter pseudolwoffii]